MEKYFTVTKEMMLGAVTYMPIKNKRDLSRQIASLCVEGKKTAEQNRAGESLMAFPAMRGEDAALKSMLLLNTLLGFYFDIELPEKDGEGKDVDSYARHDYYAGGHILNQIERFKKDEMCRERAYELLSDYKEFRIMVDTEIANLKAVNNDGLARFTAACQIFSSPEVLRELMNELKSVAGQTVETLAERGEKEPSNG